MHEIQAHSARNLVLLHERTVPAEVAVNVERRAHWLLRESHFRGEWFSVPPHEAIAAVERAANEGGEGERAGSLAGRKKLWAENVNLTLPAGAKERMNAALREGEDRLDLIRSAIETELKKREKAKASGLRDAGDSGIRS